MKEVIILGHGPTRMQCPYDKETWGINNCYEFAKRLDKLFTFDPITHYEFDIEKLKKLPCVVSSYKWPGYDNLELYPLKEILQKFRTSFFSNGICYMIAYALYKEYERIYFYGIDMMTNTTYIFEKGGVEYWMGIAHAMGVPVINTPESCTGKSIDGRLYGYWGPELENLSTYNKIVLAEAKRLMANFEKGFDEKVKSFDQDPDGHLYQKWDKIRQQNKAYQTVNVVGGAKIAKT